MFTTYVLVLSIAAMCASCASPKEKAHQGKAPVRQDSALANEDADTMSARASAVEKSAVCPLCKGSGIVEVQCPYCSGKGYQGTSRNPQTCIVCKGTGKLRKACTRCGGTGVVADSQ